MIQSQAILERLSADGALLKASGAAEPNSDRLRSASETVARMRSQFDRFGITRLAEVTRLDRIGIPVWMAIRPNSRTLAVSQGKGVDDAAAQASAVMEAAELATAERTDLPLRWCSADQLRAEGECVTPMHDLLCRDAAVPAASEHMPWIEGYDLLRQQPAWVPAELVSLSIHPENADGKSRFWWSSDGLASGTLLLEATVHGLCERIERDACVLWSLRSDQDVFDRCVHPASLGDDAVVDLAARIEAAGLQLRLFEITTDIRVPVFFATISPSLDGSEGNWKHFDLSSGSGCHPSAARAAIRAITEAAQSRVTSIAGARDDFDPQVYRSGLASDLFAYLRASPKSAAAGSTETVPEPADNLSFLVDRLAAAGINAAIVVPLAVDHGFAVAKVLVQELEHLPGDRKKRFGKRALRLMAGT